MRRVADGLAAAKAKGGVVGGIKRVGWTAAAAAAFARLYLLPAKPNELPAQIRMAPAW
jgi:magnesium-protoporphyrin IX monomethyl ester (oxidative) cyclase